MGGGEGREGGAGSGGVEVEEEEEEEEEEAELSSSLSFPPSESSLDVLSSLSTTLPPSQLIRVPSSSLISITAPCLSISNVSP